MLRLKANEKTGIWQIHGTVAGQRIRRSSGTRNKQTAQKELRRLEAEAWELIHSPYAQVVTFEAAALAYMQSNGETRFLAPLIKHFAGKDIQFIKPGHVRDAAKALYPGRAPATWNRQAVTPVQAVINFAAERGWCQPLRVARFKTKPPKRRAANREWLDAFMQAADEELATLALFMFTTGARISDALRITSINGRSVSMMTKTGPRDAIMSLELTERLNGPFRWKHRWSVYKLWRKACEDAGIDYLPPHQAGRHAFATEMVVRNRVDAKTAADLGGWKSTRMLEAYTHSEALEEVVDEVFGSSAKVDRVAKD